MVRGVRSLSRVVCLVCASVVGGCGGGGSGARDGASLVAVTFSGDEAGRRDTATPTDAGAESPASDAGPPPSVDAAAPGGIVIGGPGGGSPTLGSTSPERARDAAVGVPAADVAPEARDASARDVAARDASA